MPPSDPDSGLKRGLTLVPAAAIIIAIVIGTGVFVKARVMTCNVGEPGLVLAVYALAGLLTLFGALAYAELATMMPRAGGDYNYLGAAMIGALWSYNGWQYMVGVAGEVHDPSRTLPRALVGATGLIVLLYLLVNAAYFYVLTPEAVASVSTASSVAREVAVRFLGAGAASVMAAGLVLSSFGTLYTSILTTSRVPFAMARDGLLPRPVARLTPGAHVPRNAVILTGTLGILYAASGTFEILSDLFVFATLLFQALTVGAVFMLRRTRPEAERPYRVWGYPVVPALYLLAVGFLLVNTLFATPGRALAGLGLIALGLPVYVYYARRLPPDDPADWLGEDAESAVPTESIAVVA